MARVGRPRKSGTRELNGRPQRPSIVGDEALLYIAKTGHFTKVGYTGSLKERVSRLQGSCPTTIRFARSWRLSRDDAHLIEQSFHNRHRGGPMHAQREWYHFGVDYLATLIEREAAVCGITLAPDTAYHAAA